MSLLQTSLGNVPVVGQFAGTIASALTGLLGSKPQVYGADFATRQADILSWLTKYNLAGANEKYINPVVLQSFAIESPGKPSIYTQSNKTWTNHTAQSAGVWQDDIPWYFQTIQNTLLGTVNKLNPFYTSVSAYINSNPNTSLSTISGQVSNIYSSTITPTTASVTGSSTTIAIIIILVIGGIYLSKHKGK